MDSTYKRLSINKALKISDYKSIKLEIQRSIRNSDIISANDWKLYNIFINNPEPSKKAQIILEYTLY